MSGNRQGTRDGDWSNEEAAPEEWQGMREIRRPSLFCRNCGRPQGSNLAMALLVLLLVVSLGSYVAFTISCALHAENLAVP